MGADLSPPLSFSWLSYSMFKGRSLPLPAFSLDDNEVVYSALGCGATSQAAAELKAYLTPLLLLPTELFGHARDTGVLV